MTENERKNSLSYADMIAAAEDSNWDPPSREEEKAATKLTVEELFVLEPRLKDLYEEARAIRPKGPHFCANHIWLNHLKMDMVELVGFGRPDYDAILSTSAAYDLAYHEIYNQLPGCRNCACMPWPQDDD